MPRRLSASRIARDTLGNDAIGASSERVLCLFMQVQEAEMRGTTKSVRWHRHAVCLSAYEEFRQSGGHADGDDLVGSIRHFGKRVSLGRSACVVNDIRVCKPIKRRLIIRDNDTCVFGQIAQGAHERYIRAVAPHFFGEETGVDVHAVESRCKSDRGGCGEQYAGAILYGAY